jgi:hypothetical protein
MDWTRVKLNTHSILAENPLEDVHFEHLQYGGEIALTWI